MVSWLENMYVLKNSFPQTFLIVLVLYKHLHFIKSSLNFVYSRKQSQSFYLILQVSYFLPPCLYLHWILWISSARLLIRFDNELAINLVLLINCYLLDIVFMISFPFLSILVTSFSFGTEKVMYFWIFSPKQAK